MRPHNPELHGPYRFRLIRHRDPTGVSGTGYVADGVMFDGGKCALRWRSNASSVAIFDRLDQVYYVHCHDDDTEIEWLDQRPHESFLHGARNCIQDSMENCPFASVGGLEARTGAMAPPAKWGLSEEQAAEYVRGYVAQAEDMYGADWMACEFSWGLALKIGDGGPTQS